MAGYGTTSRDGTERHVQLLEYLSGIVGNAIEFAERVLDSHRDADNIMVLMPCHGIYHEDGLVEEDNGWKGKLESIFNEECWYTSYSNDVKHYIGHIAAAYAIAGYLSSRGKGVAVVISGGPVKKKVNGEWKRPPEGKSEASSYETVGRMLRAAVEGYLDERKRQGNLEEWESVLEHILSAESTTLILDENAYSSYGNLIFGLYAYYRSMGKLPDLAIIVGWGFKEKRFRHYAGLHGIEMEYFPANNPDEGEDEAARAEEEMLDVIEKEGPAGETLQNKRDGRGQTEEGKGRLEEAWNGGEPLKADDLKGKFREWDNRDAKNRPLLPRLQGLLPGTD